MMNESMMVLTAVNLCVWQVQQPSITNLVYTENKFICRYYLLLLFYWVATVRPGLILRFENEQGIDGSGPKPHISVPLLTTSRIN